MLEIELFIIVILVEFPKNIAIAFPAFPPYPPLPP